MKDFDFNFWTERESAANFSDPEACATRSTAFEKTIRRRNVLEYAAGVFVIVVFGAGAVGTASAGLWDFAAAQAAVVIGTFFILWKLHSNGSNLARHPEEPCRLHHRAQLVRQRDLLRDVPRWYLAPLVPGILGVYLAGISRASDKAGWIAAVGDVWVPLFGTVAFIIFVGWLNLRTARKLDREIAAVDAAS
ncbi:hypothetical protein [Qipengyuania sphaerica]|uniref:hypothetical protein n=1 Tax=Qipengyuania sphaerica TaxID=2867243 RepID=UPI001C871A7C|nr:hypothetical protein [Qipengyuania sphaerica]MBX7540717.1 hypothetical protein [Qipengyuania sphaerica]